MREGLQRINLGVRDSFLHSTARVVTFPPDMSTMSCVAISKNLLVALGSTPFSNRCKPSERTSVFLTADLTAKGSKFATSNKIVVVDSEMLLLALPMTPAIAMGFFASEIMRVPQGSVIDLPVSVSKGSD